MVFGWSFNGNLVRNRRENWDIDLSSPIWFGSKSFDQNHPHAVIGSGFCVLSLRYKSRNRLTTSNPNSRAKFEFLPHLQSKLVFLFHLNSRVIFGWSLGNKVVRFLGFLLWKSCLLRLRIAPNKNGDFLTSALTSFDFSFCCKSSTFQSHQHWNFAQKLISAFCLRGLRRERKDYFGWNWITCGEWMAIEAAAAKLIWQEISFQENYND